MEAIAVIILAHVMPQDHYYMANPQEYFHRGCEEALIDTDNAGIVKFHLMFAAHESPLTRTSLRPLCNIPEHCLPRPPFLIAGVDVSANRSESS
jgi:hypothetical protein